MKRNKICAVLALILFAAAVFGLAEINRSIQAGTTEIGFERIDVMGDPACSDGISATLVSKLEKPHALWTSILKLGTGESPAETTLEMPDDDSFYPEAADGVYIYLDPEEIDESGFLSKWTNVKLAGYHYGWADWADEEDMDPVNKPDIYTTHKLADFIKIRFLDREEFLTGVEDPKLFIYNLSVCNLVGSGCCYFWMDDLYDVYSGLDFSAMGGPGIYALPYSSEKADADGLCLVWTAEGLRDIIGVSLSPNEAYLLVVYAAEGVGPSGTEKGVYLDEVSTYSGKTVQTLKICDYPGREPFALTSDSGICYSCFFGANCAAIAGPDGLMTALGCEGENWSVLFEYSMEQVSGTFAAGGFDFVDFPDGIAICYNAETGAFAAGATLVQDVDADGDKVIEERLTGGFYIAVWMDGKPGYCGIYRSDLLEPALSASEENIAVHSESLTLAFE